MRRRAGDRHRGRTGALRLSVFRRHPALAVTAATLGVVTATLSLSALAGRPVAQAALLHAAVLGLFLLLASGADRLPDPGAGPAARGVLVVAVMFFLYGSLGHAAFDAIPWSGDPWLRAADRLLLPGREPALAAADAVAGAPWVVEPLAFFYAAFIPYLYLSIFLGLVGRAPRARAEFTTAFALLYGMAFLGYLFVPARGPVVELAGAFPAPLEGGRFLALVVSSVDRMGGPHGAFPSLHLGASLLACLFDLRRGDPLRGMVYLPLVALIAVATVALRYHWVVDLAAGGAMAAAALALAPRLLGQGRDAREAP